MKYRWVEKDQWFLLILKWIKQSFVSEFGGGPSIKKKRWRRNLDIMECRRPHVPVHTVHTLFYINFTPTIFRFEEPQMLVKVSELEKRQVDPCKEAPKKNWVESKCLERKPLPTKWRLSGNVHFCINWMYLGFQKSCTHSLIHLFTNFYLFSITHYTIYLDLGYFNLTLSVLVACWHMTKFKELE